MILESRFPVNVVKTSALRGSLLSTPPHQRNRKISPSLTQVFCTRGCIFFQSNQTKQWDEQWVLSEEKWVWVWVSVLHTSWLITDTALHHFEHQLPHYKRKKWTRNSRPYLPPKISDLRNTSPHKINTASFIQVTDTIMLCSSLLIN